MFLGSVLRAALLLPEKVSPLSGALLDLRLQGVSIRHQLAASTDMRSRMQAGRLCLGHQLHAPCKLDGLVLGVYGFRVALFVFHSDRKDVEDRVSDVQDVNQALFHAACPMMYRPVHYCAVPVNKGLRLELGHVGLLRSDIGDKSLRGDGRRLPVVLGAKSRIVIV